MSSGGRLERCPEEEGSPPARSIVLGVRVPGRQAAALLGGPSRRRVPPPNTGQLDPPGLTAGGQGSARAGRRCARSVRSPKRSSWAGTPSARAQATMGVARCQGRNDKEVPDEHGMWLGSASRPDHLRCVGGRLGRGVAGPVVATGSAAVPALAGRGVGTQSARWSGGGGGRGLHRVALCRGGGHRRGLRGARGGTGRHPGGPGPQEARQDRPQRLAPAARTAPERGSARELDSARGGVGVAGAGEAVQVAHGPAQDLDPAYSRRALPPRRRAARRRDRFGEDTPVAGRRYGPAQRRRPPADRGRLSHDRRHHRRGPGPATGPATLRSTPARMPGPEPRRTTASGS